LIIWAGLVSYSRVYLGVHFPLDVVVGAMMGALLGFALRRFALSLMKTFH